MATVSKMSVEEISIHEYTYVLPNERIAVYPLENRDDSKLLVYNKGSVHDTRFNQLPDFFKQGDSLWFNNSKVIHARMIFRKSTGARIEIVCLEPSEPADFSQVFTQTESCVWKCMVGNLKKWNQESLCKHIEIDGNTLELTIQKLTDDRTPLVRFSWDNPEITFGQLLESQGQVPLPPYLNRQPEASDNERYQTIYSKIQGSVAAPTAGLHFTSSTLDTIRAKGTHITEVTLHVGAGTFLPVKSDTLGEHQMHSEHFVITTKLLNDLLQNKGALTAVGTTTVRTLESVYWLGVKCIQNKGVLTEKSFNLEQWEAYQLPSDVLLNEAVKALLTCLQQNELDTVYAATRILIAPGYRFRVIQRLITNFHQPDSTLLLLIAAFIGEDWRKVYQYALDNDFRFLSYGDSSLLIPSSL